MTNEEAIKLIDDRMCFGRGKWSEHHKPEIDIYWQAGEMAIKALEAEPHWIPVTERVPEKFDYYLVSGINSVWFARYESGRFLGILSGHALDTVIAWMPLPKPFMGVTT